MFWTWVNFLKTVLVPIIVDISGGYSANKKCASSVFIPFSHSSTEYYNKPKLIHSSIGAKNFLRRKSAQFAWINILLGEEEKRKKNWKSFNQIIYLYLFRFISGCPNWVYWIEEKKKKENGKRNQNSRKRIENIFFFSSVFSPLIFFFFLG